MTQAERRIFLIQYLLDERAEMGYAPVDIPSNENDQRDLLRSLVNIRPHGSVSDKFLQVQDAYLQERNREREIPDITSIKSVESSEANNAFNDIYLWRGDITTLKIDAIVNAANSGMTGCYQPCHSCIDNCIHTFAGIQLRNKCAEIMAKQGHEEPTGQAKITPAYNLPCKYVLHTVGPIVMGPLNEHHRQLLKSCYRSCLEVAAQHDVQSIAFCCVSTGVFMFPAEEAARIAVATVRDWKRLSHSSMKIVFNVFSENDETIYKKILGIK